MVIKRYTPKYKVIAKIKQALWLEKRSKIAKFKRQKWDGKKRIYFPRKPKIFNQDSSTYAVGDDFESDRSTRLKKTYKYLLQDKQTFQFYYGARRFRFYHLKYLASCARSWGQKKKISSAKVLFHFMENRLEVALYRLGFVTSLMHSRKLLSSFRVKVDEKYAKNFGFCLKNGSTIKVEPLKSVEIIARYLKFNAPFFYFRKKEDCKFYLVNRKCFLETPLLEKEKYAFFNYAKVLFQSANFKKG